MYPLHYRDNFWDVELKPQVFVAIPFHDPFETRFHEIIAPAIRDIRLSPGGARLQPFRVDLSNMGDSILTEIAQGILTSRLFLADVSTEYRDNDENAYRNGNVMYEIGLALAWREPQHVLIVHGDRDRLLFDVSTVPHKRIDFSDAQDARRQLREALSDRMMSEDFVCRRYYARAQNRLTFDEIRMLQIMAQCSPRAFRPQGHLPLRQQMALRTLIDMQAVRAGAAYRGQIVDYHLTRLGTELAFDYLPLAEDAPEA